MTERDDIVLPLRTEREGQVVGALASPRREALDETILLIEKAARSGNSVWAGHEADRIARAHPECGMTAAEICEAIVKLALGRGLPVDTSR